MALESAIMVGTGVKEGVADGTCVAAGVMEPGAALTGNGEGIGAITSPCTDDVEKKTAAATRAVAAIPMNKPSARYFTDASMVSPEESIGSIFH